MKVRYWLTNTKFSHRKKDDPEFRAKNVARAKQYMSLIYVLYLYWNKEIEIESAKSRMEGSPRRRSPLRSLRTRNYHSRRTRNSQSRRRRKRPRPREQSKCYPFIHALVNFSAGENAFPSPMCLTRTFRMRIMIGTMLWLRNVLVRHIRLGNAFSPAEKLTRAWTNG